jgi:hypothetical protein
MQQSRVQNLLARSLQFRVRLIDQQNSIVETNEGAQQLQRPSSSHKVSLDKCLISL